MHFNAKHLGQLTIAILSVFFISSCSKGTSYAELIDQETHAINYFLAQNRVINDLPDDGNFEYGTDAPYYKLNSEGTLYMQVINPGSKNNMAEDDQLIYFRFTRYNLKIYMDSGDMVGNGNSNDFSNPSTSFRFNNIRVSSATTYGMGIQEPLKYLGIDCEVNLVVKAQVGPSSETASVVPYLYNLRYFPSPL